MTQSPTPSRRSTTSRTRLSAHLQHSLHIRIPQKHGPIMKLPPRDDALRTLHIIRARLPARRQEPLAVVVCLDDRLGGQLVQHRPPVCIVDQQLRERRLDDAQDVDRADVADAHEEGVEGLVLESLGLELLRQHAGVQTREQAGAAGAAFLVGFEGRNWREEARIEEIGQAFADAGAVHAEVDGGVGGVADGFLEELFAAELEEVAVDGEEGGGELEGHNVGAVRPGDEEQVLVRDGRDGWNLRGDGHVLTSRETIVCSWRTAHRGYCWCPWRSLPCSRQINKLC
jgi:hypothetical protein